MARTMEHQRIDRYTSQQERQARSEKYLESVGKTRNRKREAVPFVYKPFSFRQQQVLRWWQKDSPLKDCEGIIADGAIRSGKTLVFSLAYGLWAMENFNGMNFLICGKTVGSLRRNVILDWKRQMSAQGYSIKERRTDSMVIVSKGEVSNDFYLFGGSDERSQDLVQGITAAGVLFDEVALMPRSFVDQSVGRCSIDGSKFWFNCNPDHPKHWFKTEWIDKLYVNRQNVLSSSAQYKNLLYVHFTMDDNPSLTERVKARYKSMHSGVFYRRFILGLWCAADGLIYDSFDEATHTYAEHPKGPYAGYPKGLFESRRYIAIDYGTSNPMSFLEIIDDGDKARVESEYYYSSKEHGRQKTDTEYAEDFVKFAGSPDDVLYVVLDPSAASFKVELRNRGYRVKDADNDMRNGISKVSTMFALGKLLINKKCRYLINELLSYVWDEKAGERGDERPIKANDHACLSGETLVDTCKGKRRIADLAGKIGLVWCVDKKGKKRRGLFWNVHKTRDNAEVYEVALSDGKAIRATAEHPLLTRRGWVAVSDLKPDDEVRTIQCL